MAVNPYPKANGLSFNIIITTLIMACKQKIKDLFLKCDVFATSEFLRYDSEPEYRTMTGAFCSIATIVTFFAIFTNVIFSTFEKQNIVWSLNTVEEEVDSFEVDTQISGQAKFMFAVSIADLDLNSSPQYFDISLTMKTKINSISGNNSIIPLQQCTPSHWNVNQEILQSYYRMNFSKMLCPPIGQKIPIQGKFTSEIFKYAQVQILKCTNTSKVCVDQSSFQNKTFILNIYFLNSLVNPQLPQYLSYYLQDRNYVQFTTSYTSLLNIFISKFKITTDQSILPYQSNRQQVGPIVNNLAQIIPKQTQSKTYANIVMRRSSTTVVVNRGFQKIDQTLSYIGGLFGFVMVFLMLMREYTEYSFEIDASSHLYHQDKQSPINSDKFNFIIFIGYLFYLFLGIFGVSPQWKMMKAYDDSREQIQKQFDVRFLFERLNFIQRSLYLLFNEEETKLMHLKRKPTLKQASELRQTYMFKEMIKGGRSIEITQNNMNNETNNQFHQLNQSNNNRVAPFSNASNTTKNQMGSKIKDGFNLLRKKTLSGHQLSKKIIQDLDPYIVQIIHQANLQNDAKSMSENSMEHLQRSDREPPKNTQLITQAFEQQAEAVDKQKPNITEIVSLMNIQRKRQEGNFQFMN